MRNAPATPTPPPASSRFTEEPLTVGSGEWALPGTLTIPKGTIKAAVVLVHGSGPQDRDTTVGPNKPFRDLAWGLADRGIAVVRYEKRTRQHGAKLGSAAAFTVREEVIDDAVLAVKWLQARSGIDPRRVFVVGHSLGGTLAPRIASTESSVAGIVIMAGATRPIDEVVRDQVLYLASQNPSAPPVDVEQAVATLRRAASAAYWADFDAYRPGAAAAALTIPILILQGERDYQVTRADLQGWHAALDGRPNVTFKGYPALNHLFLPGEGPSVPAEYLRPGRVPDVVFDDIAGWIGMP
jgi:dienelactone hydrolase